MTEVWGLPEKARRVLQATAVEAYGRPGMYVVMAQVMRRANLSDPEEFRAIAQYLEERGWIAEADPDYGVFVLTPERRALGRGSRPSGANLAPLNVLSAAR